MEAHKFFTEGEGIEQRLKTQLKELRDDFAERLARKRFKCDQKFSQLEAKINSQKMEINDLKLDKVRMEKTIDDLEKTIDDLKKTVDFLIQDKTAMNLRMTEMEAKMHKLFNFHENEKRKCAKGLEWGEWKNDKANNK